MFVMRIVSFFTAIGAFFTALFGGYSDVYFNNYVKINMIYGKEERQVLDLYLPKKAEGETGLVMLIHGGAWIIGDKDQYRNELKFWSDRGYAAAAVNYRYVSENSDMQNILEDITSALTKIKSFGEKKKVNINKVLFTGTSAGAHLSMLYAYSKVDESPIKPAAVVEFCGPVDLSNPELVYGKDYQGNLLGDEKVMTDLLSKCCGKTITPENLESSKEMLLEISPLTYLNKNVVPTVIAHGASDHVVPYGDALTLDRELTKYGVKHDFVTYSNSDHGLESDPESAEAARQLFIEYAETYLK